MEFSRPTWCRIQLCRALHIQTSQVITSVWWRTFKKNFLHCLPLEERMGGNGPLPGAKHFKQDPDNPKQAAWSFRKGWLVVRWGLGLKNPWRNYHIFSGRWNPTINRTQRLPVTGVFHFLYWFPQELNEFFIFCRSSYFVLALCTGISYQLWRPLVAYSQSCF